ncbi:hypothetical protein FD723_40800 (plasmid) [Nostoc sp. C052]|uniref:hypothetical protein n=1 Tax=Nostoc sp. C052 TaxID=2576902 RepID=UPI0015C39041|nr:hypothetical protein [Nostoc sp. C052]QLE46555.1 hypothetical protein FD723_40800 [Nostoc sp. C052]
MEIRNQKTRTVSLYYLGFINKNNEFCCLIEDEISKQRIWKPYNECEQQNWKDIIVLPSKEIYELHDSMVGYSQYSGISVCNNSSQRKIYIQLEWSDDGNVTTCKPAKKIIAESHYQACKILGVSREESSSVVHYSDILRLEIEEAFIDAMELG